MDGVIDIKESISRRKIDGYIERLQTEDAQLGKKMEKLTAFTASPEFMLLNEEDKHLLLSQMFVMQSYQALLGLRLLRVSSHGFIPAAAEKL